MIRGDLAVRLDGGTTDRIVTERNLSGLKFSKTAPGGHASASCNLALPRSLLPDLGPANRLYVYDTRTGRTVWEGYTNNPSALTSDEGGQSFDLTALGGMALASERAERLIYIDTSHDQWRRDDYAPMAPSATVGSSPLPDTGTQALMLQFNPGQPISGSATAKMVYDAFVDSTMTFGGYSTTNRCGVTDANYQSQWLTNDSTVIATRNFSTGAATSAKFAVTDFPAASTLLKVVIARVAGGATNIASDDVWGGFANVKVCGRRMDKFGTALTLTSATSVLASEIVADLLGRVLTACDPVTSVVETTTYAIDQIAYLAAARAADVLADLTLYEPDFLWEILESNSAGKHRFNYRAWPTSPRYMIDPREHVEQPGSDVDLCNRIVVNWTDAKGAPQSTVRTATVPALGTRIRDAEPVTLPEGRGSLANAQRIGDQILAATASAPKAARATITRPLIDKVTGNPVQPWEIEPGYVARIQATGDNLRITEMEYDDASCSTDLTLGDPVLTLEQRLARLVRRGASEYGAA